ncbi:hypothetical protein [Oscillatoria sp. FACHB-1406]|uniref:hypothetical protein n=1 Tax=Oscillatoria sp. FACHB-1406 TaxID=2692846 RepID=UPI001F54CBD1|nr:hypothetical protein [Oscillatoria sp. FACHB-1406]
MSDEQIIKAAENLNTLALIKSANTYNRYCQSQKTAEANEKLKQFIDVKNSEIYKAGQWLLNCLSRTGQDRKESLIKKKLVHKEDYNEAVVDLTDTVSEQKVKAQQQTLIAQRTIEDIQQTNDSLRKQLAFIQEYIENNYSHKDWKDVKKYLQKNI